MLENAIRSWMSAIPDTIHEAPTSNPPRKRRRVYPPTPTNSDKCSRDGIAFIDTAHMSEPRTGAESLKRPPPIDNVSGPFYSGPTPRPTRSKRLQTAHSESSYSLSAPSIHSQQSSGRFSPHKQIQLLELDPQGLRFDDFAHFDNPSRSIQELLDKVEDITEGSGIVSPTMRDQLTEASQKYRDFRWVSRRSGYFDSRRDEVGHTPTPGEVLDIVAAAAECSTSMHPEVNWNSEVHQRLLTLAYRPRDKEQFGNLVNFIGTTTASIIPEYGNSTQLKKVDFCVYVEPANENPEDLTALSAITRIRRTLPGNMFNFTDFTPLKGRPIAFSIETKRPSEGFDTAKLQLGVWQMAHWCFLQQLIVRLGHASNLGEISHGRNDGDAATSPEVTQLPVFIPGVIIQGHDWHLVISTLKDQQTKIWQKVTMGSTSSSKGIYQIVNTLQVLRSWITKSYWPWLRKIIVESSEG